MMAPFTGRAGPRIAKIAAAHPHAQDEVVREVPPR